jgi:hypothetical protein
MITTRPILKMGPTGCPETSVKDYHSTLSNISKGRRSPQHHFLDCSVSVFAIKQCRSIQTAVTFRCASCPGEAVFGYYLAFYEATDYRRALIIHSLSLSASQTDILASNTFIYYFLGAAIFTFASPHLQVLQHSWSKSRRKASGGRWWEFHLLRAYKEHFKS